MQSCDGSVEICCKEGHVCGICLFINFRGSAYGGQESYLQGFSGETQRKEETLKTYAYTGR
jgi:hypothetical protein